MTCKGLNLGNQLVREIAYTYPISTSNSTPTAPTTTTVAPATKTTASKTTALTPTPQPPPIVEVAKVSYRGKIIRIYADASVSNPSRFFFEPIVQLDPKTIIAQRVGFLKTDFISFTIEMWNSELRRQVLARVKSLKSLINVTLGEQDIYVLPFKVVQLQGINGPLANNTIWEVKSYFRHGESLQFSLEWDSTKYPINNMVEEFRRNPGLVLWNWKMELAAQGMDLGDQLDGSRLQYIYTVVTSFYSTSLPQQQGKFI